MSSSMGQIPRHFFEGKAPDIALRSLFKKYDKDGNGQLDANELNELLRVDLGLTLEQAETYQYLLDRDGDSTVSYDEFKRWLNSNEHFQSITDKTRFYYLRQAVLLFKQFDEDGNQSLDLQEFRNLFLQAGGREENIQHAARELDEDGNGRISFQEFLKWLNWVQIDEFFETKSAQ